MAFQYTSLSGTRLNPDEEQLLESIDEFSYPFNGFANLGDLHKQLNGNGVVLSDQTPAVNHPFKISVQEHDEMVVALKGMIDELNQSMAEKTDELMVARNSGNWNLAHVLGQELEELGRQLKHVSDQLMIFKNAMQLNGCYSMQAIVPVLGEYDSSNKQVILYCKTIKKEKCSIAEVYVHEMMHAYLDCGPTFIEEIEEPIVEYGMLTLLKAFGKVSLFMNALENVEGKKHTMGLAHYGFGYGIFMNSNGIDWLEDYRKAKPSLSSSDPRVPNYMNYWESGIYPFLQEQSCLQALYDVLHVGGLMKTMTIHHLRRHKTVQSTNKHDLLNKLSYYLTLPTAKTSLNTITPYNHRRWLCLGGLNMKDTVEPYMKWIDHSEHPELLPLLNKHGITNIYYCGDLNKLVAMYDELVRNITIEAKSANQHSNMVSAVRHFIEHLLQVNGITI